VVYLFVCHNVGNVDWKNGGNFHTFVLNGVLEQRMQGLENTHKPRCPPKRKHRLCLVGTQQQKRSYLPTFPLVILSSTMVWVLSSISSMIRVEIVRMGRWIQ
jgi:hypothetical protein